MPSVRKPDAKQLKSLEATLAEFKNKNRKAFEQNRSALDKMKRSEAKLSAIRKDLDNLIGSFNDDGLDEIK